MKRLFFFLMSLIFATQILAATTYYVDAVNGNDSNSGQSQSSAWRTLSRIKYQSFSAGDTILLKRGQTWRENLAIENISGTASSPITFGAYGSGTKPQINGADFNTSGWSFNTGKIYSKSFAYETKVVVEDSKLLEFFPWEGSVSSTFEGASAGSWSCNPNNKTAYVWCTDGADPDIHTIEVSASVRTGSEEYGISIKNASYITVMDIEVMNTTYSGIKIMPDAGKRTDNITLRRLHIFNTGSTGIEVNNGRNSATGSNEITGLLIEECVVHDTNWHGIILMYEVVGAKIANNTVYRTGWSKDASHGISAWSDRTNAYVHNCLIEGNIVYEVRARESTGTEGTGIHADDLTKDCTYRYNICYNNEGSGLYFNGTSGCKYHYNISYGNGRVLAGGYRGGITLTQPVNIEVYNNVVYDNYPNGIAWMDPTTNGVIIKNNILIQNGEYEIKSGIDAGRNVVSNNNCVYHPAGGKFMKWLGRNCDWTEWKSLSGHDLNSKYGNPQFVSLSNKNFDLQSSSPCIDTGTYVGLTEDFLGTSVPAGQQVDIGAFEYVSSSSFAASIGADPLSGTPPLSVAFSRTISGGTSPYTTFWDFGDGGTSTVNSPSYIFTDVGSYTVVLTVTDAAGKKATATQTITVRDDSNVFNVGMSASPTSGTIPLTVEFTRQVSGTTGPYTYLWQFGDGDISRRNNPVHTYTAAATYTVTLTVTNSLGQEKTVSGTIIAKNPSLFTVGMSASPTSGTAPLTVQFTRHVSGGTGPFTYLWQFGDGDTSKKNNPTHTYTTAGTYTVILTVTDSTGLKKTVSGTIRATN